MSVLLQVSDPHFGTEQPAVVDALVELACDLDPAMLVLSGDITQRATRAQFDAAREFVDRLGVPERLVLPGNHDISLFNVFSRVLRPYANMQRVFGEAIETEMESRDMLVIGVNTTRRLRHKDGDVSEEQVAHVSERLRTASASQLRIVVTHQPVHIVQPIDEPNLLHGREAAVRAWADAGADIIMGGHIHLPYVRALSEGYDDLPRRIWCVQAGTAVSSRVRHDAPNSVNVVRYAAASTQRRCVVERWDHVAAHRRFEKMGSVEMLLDRPKRRTSSTGRATAKRSAARRR